MNGTPVDAVVALLRRPRLARLLDVLDRDGEETRIVGGAVRNALLGREVIEIDLATTAVPEVTAARARAAGLKPVPTGIEHGTVTVVVEGEPFEVTTLREDVETDGRHAVVRFGRDFSADARRRDFTINALSAGRDGTVHDDVSGLADLAAGRVRFIGDPRGRIREDFLRILRFFRFSAEYARGPFDEPGLQASIGERDGLAHLSRERVRAEFLKLLGTARAVEAVQVLSEAGLLLALTGSVGELGRLVRARGGSIAEPLVSLAALAVVKAEDVDRLRDRLRLSNAEQDVLAVLARLFERLHSVEVLDRPEVRRLAALHGSQSLAQACLILGGEPRPALTPDGAAQLAAFASGSEGRPIFTRRGADLIREGAEPGPELGRRLAAERQAWLDAGCPA